MRAVVVMVVLFFAGFTLPCQAASAGYRVFEFTYEMLAGEIPSSEVVDIYIPRPTDRIGQRILNSQLRASLPVGRGWEARYHNGYYHLRRPANINAPIELSFNWTVRRDDNAASQEQVLSSQEREKYLKANTLVPVSHHILDPILAEIRQLRKNPSKAATARAIYDWIVDNIEYKKVGTGWGNGDTFWACNERYGNCTDFHALFISLARSEGIPARFEIGFPVPQGKSSGDIAGYHCWVQLFLPGQGWVPVDASEAAKHPEKRELYFGIHPPDRIHFSTGRDITFTEASKALPLNYFIYPYMEVGGKPWNTKVQTRFHYKVID
ncbi:MAG: transglutaminase domain-containing protein [Gammaproteobacteria bacterium]|nr:MAG: transglutaminase domain-containing protein [Gammaproteobacteria bacterium]RLA61882.1 MAG: transglutaminase domain-containing protein [Gammaproteobacteria bacterium]